jgi:hypothetical protein
MKNGFLLSILLAMHMVLVVVSSSSSSELFLQEFPPTERRLIHGLCVYGLESVSVTSDYEPLTYEPVKPFEAGMKLWGNREFIATGVFCEGGGTYLRPSISRVKNVPTKIAIRGSIEPGAGVAKICYFTGKAHWNEDGGWGELPEFEYVKDDTWDPTVINVHGPSVSVSKIYCRNLNKRVTLKLHL